MSYCSIFKCLSINVLASIIGMSLSCNSYGQVDIVEQQGLRFVRVPAGEFLMGGNPNDEFARMNESPQKGTVIPADLFVTETEISHAQFKRFVDESSYRTTEEQNGSRDTWRSQKGEPHNPKYPVRNVSWVDANAFCNWLNKSETGSYRLPTEVEWEYACRAGAQTRFTFGDDARKLDDRYWVGRTSRVPPQPQGDPWRGTQRNHPVEVHMLQANRFGLKGMHGNVSEWCSSIYRYRWTNSDDTYQDYSGAQLEKSIRRKVLRGGNYSRGGPENARCSYRSWADKERSQPHWGFRVVWEPKSLDDCNDSEE